MTITLDEIFFSVLNKFYEVCLLVCVCVCVCKTEWLCIWKKLMNYLHQRWREAYNPKPLVEDNALLMFP